MTYLPLNGGRAFENVTTSEQLSGRTVDGTASYVKLIKSAGSLTAGAANNIAHGITGMTRLISMQISVRDQTPQCIPIPNGIASFNATNRWGLSGHVTSTDVVLNVGAKWAATNALDTVYIVLEYLK